MPITLVSLFLNVEQNGAAFHGATFVLKTTQGQFPFIVDGALEINRQVRKTSSSGRVDFAGVVPSADLLTSGFTDGRYNLSSPDIPSLNADFLVPRAGDADFSGGDISALIALSVPEGESALPINIAQGWSPLIANIADGARVVQRVVDWTGGMGDKPATGLYLGATGLVASIADATDVRGVQGIAGPTGPAGGGGGGVSSYNDLTDKPTLGNSASRNVGTTAGTVAAGDDSRFGGGSSITGGTGTLSVDSTSAKLNKPFLLQRESGTGTVRDAVAIDTITTDSSDANFGTSLSLKTSHNGVMAERVRVTNFGINIFGSEFPLFQIGTGGGNALQLYWYQNAGYFGTVENAHPLYFAGSATFFNAPVTAAHDASFSNSAKGVVLKDRTTNTNYRLFVNNGVLGVEAA